MKLKPCPFCGGEATTFAGGIDMYGSLMYGVMCKNTACCVIPSKYPSKEAAIEAWNRREPIDMIVKQLEELISYNKERSRMYDGHTHYDSEIMGISKAIEIVKGGSE